MNKLLIIFISLIFFIFPLGQLTKLPLGIPGISIYLHDLMIVLLDIILLFGLLKKKLPFKLNFFDKLIICFILILLFSWLINLKRWGSGNSFLGLLYWLRWTSYSGIYFGVKQLAKKYKNQWGIRAKKLIIGSGVSTAIIGLAQYILIPDLRFMKFFNWDDHYYRLVGTFFDPAFIGIIITLTILFLLITVQKKNFNLYCLLVILSISLFLTYSRSSYLALFAGLFLFSVIRKRIKLFIVAVVFGIGVMHFLPRYSGESTNVGRFSTIFSRLDNYHQSFLIAKENYLLGVGFNNTRLIKKEKGYLSDNFLLSHSGSGVDNSFLFVAITSGIIGILLFITFYIFIIRNKLLSILFIPLIIHAQFNNTLFYPWILIWQWLILGSFFKDDK